MAQLLIRNLDPKVVERLKDQARQNGRTLEAEGRDILERSANQTTIEEFRRRSREFRKQFGGRKLPDSVDLIREGRER